MKVVQINSVYGTKSTGTIVRDIAELLACQGDSPVVIAPDNANVIYVHGIGNTMEKKVHALYARLTGKQGLASSFSTRKLLKEMEKEKPDIIHLHNIHSNFINYSLLLRFTADKQIPVVLTLHDCWFMTGKCYHFSDIGCEKWKTGCNNCPKRFKDIPSYFGDNAHHVFELRKALYSKNNLYVVGCSKWITEAAKESPLFDGADIRYIYNGVNTQTFSPQVENYRKKYAIQPNDFVIITMANKWFDPANERISAKIREKMDNNDWLIIVGCKESQCAQMKKQDNKKKIIMLPHIHSREELAKIYCTGNVFVNLTHIDTLPTVNMEAASCGLPIITYQSGGSGELVDHGRTGYVVHRFEDDSAILDAIDQVKAGKISSVACRAKAISSFGKESNYKKYLELYQEICKE